MRISILFVIFTFTFFTASAQTNSETTTNDTSTVYSYCEVMPTLKTKEYKSFGEYVSANLMYPNDAKAAKISGYTYVQFIIEKDGSVSNVQIISGRGLHPSCDAEAIRVISNSPKWQPAIHNGKVVRCRSVQKIGFILYDSPGNTKK